MISGFNTDIDFEGKVYHVQTEDKGLDSCLIVSLVYDRGTILASKRTSYDDLAAGKLDEKALSDRVNRQHKLICGAVKAGRFDELKGMSAKSKAASAKPKVEAVAVAEPVGMHSRASSELEVTDSTPFTSDPTTPLAEHVVSVPAAPAGWQPETNRHDAFDDGPVIEAVEVIEEVMLPAEAVEVVSELSGQERPTDTKLSIELLGESKFKGGERRTVNIMVCRGTARKVVSEAQIMIKVLGSSFRPVIFHARTDSNGLAKVHLQLPHFHAGRAALLVRAISGTEEVELRRVVTPG